ncbi:MAG: 3-deoxy-manno-octulosonate cytidylyltransferase [Planctomycetota bacterium]
MTDDSSASARSAVNSAVSSAVAILPARFASERLPGKPLLDQTGKTLIQHVCERAQSCPALARVAVATDDRRIADAVHAFGGEAVMTSADHPNGTSRIAEAADRLGLPDDALVVNIQGDEPEIAPELIACLIQTLTDDPGAPVATVAAPLGPNDDPQDPNLVKAVVSRQGRALYFSRSPIPHVRDAANTPSTDAASPCLKHVGVYAYRRTFLPVYVELEPTPLEQAEKLEQLRVLEHGHAIAVGLHPADHQGIDTPEQYAAFVRRQAARA